MGIFSWFRKKKPTDGDEAVLVQLRKAGSDLSKPHQIEFFLYFPSQDAAEQGAAQIRNTGFDAKVQLSAKGDSWLCFATKRMIPDLASLDKIRIQFEALAGKLGGEYDGWGTPVEK